MTGETLYFLKRMVTASDRTLMALSKPERDMGDKLVRLGHAVVVYDNRLTGHKRRVRYQVTDQGVMASAEVRPTPERRFGGNAGGGYRVVPVHGQNHRE